MASSNEVLPSRFDFFGESVVKKMCNEAMKLADDIENGRIRRTNCTPPTGVYENCITIRDSPMHAYFETPEGSISHLKGHAHGTLEILHRQGRFEVGRIQGQPIFYDVTRKEVYPCVMQKLILIESIVNQLKPFYEIPEKTWNPF